MGPTLEQKLAAFERRASQAPATISYAGASTTDKALSRWHALPASADADTIPELNVLRPRQRDLERNHGVARGALQKLVDNVVGTGLRLSAKPKYRRLGWSREDAVAWGQDAEAIFEDWADSRNPDITGEHTFAQLSAMVFRAAWGDGGVVALPYWLPGRFGNHFATTLKVLEIDRLCNPMERPDDEFLRGGVELDAHGAPVAYHIADRHPRDYWGPMWTSQRPVAWRRVPARTAWGRPRVIHFFYRERPGQHRGVPSIATVMPQFKMLDHYQQTELKAAVVNAMVAAIIETPYGQEGLVELFGGDPRAIEEEIARRNNDRVPLQGGMILGLHPGEHLTSFNPQRPAGTYGPFTEVLLRHIAAGLGTSYEALLLDFSKTNYSSARAMLLELWRFYARLRQWLAQGWHQVAYELVLEEAVSRGELKAPDFWANKAAYCGARWIGPGRGWIDPVKEATAAGIRIKNGLSTMEKECAEQGDDWREIVEQRRLERAETKDLEGGDNAA